MEICKKENCTGCGACAFVCPKKCINMRESKIGVIYPETDERRCVSCGKCRKVCPQINKVLGRKPIRAYAAWSSDPEERRTSASGGIAAEIYKLAAKKKMYMVGAECDNDFRVKLVLTDDIDKLEKFKNSKYVFSEAYDLYPRLQKLLKDSNRGGVIIGLPCQIAAIRRIFKDYDRFVLIDVVCHGTTPQKYLEQHIRMLEKRYTEQAAEVLFRDPEMDTTKFYFSLYNKNGVCFYSQRTMDGDTYQFGYHRGISYRNNCYNCIYACNQRVSDITLSDYKGLGTLASCDFCADKVSSVLINTEKGQQFINELHDELQIIAEKRPVNEPIQGDPQLRMPSVKHKARCEFEKRIRKYNGDFEKAMSKVVRHQRYRNYILRTVNEIKNILRRNIS